MPKLPRSFYHMTMSPDNLQNVQQLANKGLESLITYGHTLTNDNDTGHADIQCWKATGTTPGSANTEFSISHNLDYIPVMYHYILDRAGQLYQLQTTGTAWTAATNSALGAVYLKCTVASAHYVIILV